MSGRAPGRDWFEWHRPYGEPGSALSTRLELVQRHIARALDDAPRGPIRVVSICAGQGDDLLGVLAGHPRRADVRARLVELDARNAATARARAEALGVTGVEVVTGDASVSDAYAAMVPAEVVVVCGVFGNITDDDIRRTIGFLPRLCARGASVVWTRHRRAPDRTPAVRNWFAGAGFTELAFDGPDAHDYVGVGAHRFEGRPMPFELGVRLFDFIGYGDAALLPGA